MVGHHRWSWSDPEQQEDGPDGLTLELSPASATGYFNVVKIGKKYYAKISQTWPQPQRTLPGGFDTPREAAIRYAQFWAANEGCGEELPL